MARSFYLISYDIPNDKRRTKIMHLLEGYGERVQYSVFEVWLTELELEKLRQQLKQTMGLAGPGKERAGAKPAAEGEALGSVRIYTLCAACRTRQEVLGTGIATAEPGWRII